MNLVDSIKTLEAHNQWRRSGVEMTLKPAEVGIAIDTVILAAKKYETALHVLNQIADKSRKTKEQRLAKACVMFLESMK